MILLHLSNTVSLTSLLYLYFLYIYSSYTIQFIYCLIFTGISQTRGKLWNQIISIWVYDACAWQSITVPICFTNCYVELIKCVLIINKRILVISNSLKVSELLITTSSYFEEIARLLFGVSLLSVGNSHLLWAMKQRGVHSWVKYSQWFGSAVLYRLQKLLSIFFFTWQYKILSKKKKTPPHKTNK